MTRKIAAAKTILSLVLIASLCALAFVSTRLLTLSAELNNPVPENTYIKQTVRVAAVGDIACEPERWKSGEGANDPKQCQHAAVAKAIEATHPDWFLALGDIQYQKGELSAFNEVYDTAFSGLKNKTIAAAGNHEYGTEEADGYFDYYAGDTATTSPQTGERGKGYFATTINGWRIIVLNSNCKDIGGCGPGSPQLNWLSSELLNNSSDCTLALWHHPHRTSGTYAEKADQTSLSRDFWTVLTRARADVVLNGHDHLYERFNPLNERGEPADDGLQQFTVGTGGTTHYQITKLHAQSAFTNTTDFGFLDLTLSPKKYDWRFIAIDGRVLDSGSRSCAL